MPLVSTDRLLPGDLEPWAAAERVDRVLARSNRLRQLEGRAEGVLREFAKGGRYYVGTSWGKDSVVAADLVLRLVDPGVPVVSVVVHPIANPDCAAVRDAFLSIHPRCRLDEVEIWCRPRTDGTWGATGTLERGFQLAAQKYGNRYVSGIRAQESAGRAARVTRWGESSPRTCAPLARWRAEDVFAYLAKYELPVHPAYACSMGGVLDRGRIRVAFIGNKHGRGRGRLEWEQAYYPDVLHATGEG